MTSRVSNHKSCAATTIKKIYVFKYATEIARERRQKIIICLGSIAHIYCDNKRILFPFVIQILLAVCKFKCDLLDHWNIKMTTTRIKKTKHTHSHTELIALSMNLLIILFLSTYRTSNNLKCIHRVIHILYTQFNFMKCSLEFVLFLLAWLLVFFSFAIVIVDFVTFF